MPSEASPGGDLVARQDGKNVLLGGTKVVPFAVLCVSAYLLKLLSASW